MSNPADLPQITRRRALAAAAFACAPAALGGSSAVQALAQGPSFGIPRTAAMRTLGGRVLLPDGRCLGYADFGYESGPLVLYFHGVPGSRLEGALIADDALACGVRVVSIDRPGLGLSTFHSGRRVLDWPADAMHVAHALGYRTGVIGILGLSGGAPYALACIRCVPERVGHVGIVSGHTPMNVPGAGRGSQDRFIEFITRRPRLAKIAIGLIIRRLHRNPSAVLSRVARELAASDRRLLLDDSVNRAGFLANLQAATSQGPWPVINAVNLLARDWGFRLDDLPPSSISIWQGACDPIAPSAMGHYFHQHLAGSELYVDPKAGHVTMLKWHAREILSRFV